MIVRTTKPTDGPKGIRPTGTEIIHKDAWRLVLLGVAEPVDQECIDKLAELDERKAAARERREFIDGHRAEIAAAQPAPPPEDRSGRQQVSEASNEATATQAAGDVAEADTETE